MKAPTIQRTNIGAGRSQYRNDEAYQLGKEEEGDVSIAEAHRIELQQADDARARAAAEGFEL